MRVWNVADAKARLSEVLRRSEEEGPQRIGTRKTFVVVLERLWEERRPDVGLGRWLVARMPRCCDLQLPDRRSGRAVPFSELTAGTAESSHENPQVDTGGQLQENPQTRREREPPTERA